jgi:hypothetical protein
VARAGLLGLRRLTGNRPGTFAPDQVESQKRKRRSLTCRKDGVLQQLRAFRRVRASKVTQAAWEQGQLDERAKAPLGATALAQFSRPVTSVHQDRRHAALYVAHDGSEDLSVSYDAVARAISAACLPPDTILSLHPGPGSTEPIEFINYETDYSDVAAGELVSHVRGHSPDLDSAGIALRNAAVRNLQILAVAANAAILAPHLLLIYEPRAGGRFRLFRTLGWDPQGARRIVDVDRTGTLVQAFDRHPKQDRLLRAAENYGESLKRIHPASPMEAAIHLWIAVENLTEVVADRLKGEYGAATLVDVGVELGLKPEKPGQDLDPRSVRGEIRRRAIFDGDNKTYKALREASDGIEHGYLSFGEARDRVDQIFEPAASAIRRSILRESGLPADDVDALLGGVFTRPLPLWRPVLVADGSFSDTTGFDFVNRPAHMRLDSAWQIHSIDPSRHATEASFEPHVSSHDGLEHALERVGLAAPGESRLSAD